MDDIEQILSQKLKSKVTVVLDKKINPELSKHHGWIEIEKIVGNNVYIRFRGACSGCMSTDDTFNKHVKPKLMNELKEIKDVFIANDVSDELIDFARSILTKNK